MYMADFELLQVGWTLWPK